MQLHDLLKGRVAGDVLIQVCDNPGGPQSVYVRGDRQRFHMLHELMMWGLLICRRDPERVYTALIYPTDKAKIVAQHLKEIQFIIADLEHSLLNLELKP